MPIPDQPAEAIPAAPSKPLLESGTTTMAHPNRNETLASAGLRSFFYGWSNFRSIVKLFIYFLIVYVLFHFVLVTFAAFFLFTPLGVLITLAVIGAVGIMTTGYFLQFYTDVVIGSMEGLKQAPDIPSFSVGGLFGMGMHALGILLVYVVPIVTIPLLPLGLLALACTSDLRTYNLRWATRAASKRPGALLTTWAMLLLWGAIMVAAVLGVYFCLALASGAIIKAIPGPGGGFLAFIVSVVAVCLIGAVISAFQTMQFRCIGHLGRFEDNLTEDLPENPGTQDMVYLGIGIAVSFFIIYVVLPAISGSTSSS